MLRPYEASDLESCVALYITTFAAPPWSELWEPAIVRARLEQLVGTPGFFGMVMAVDADDGGIDAFALGVREPWHEGCHYYLKEACVDPARQRQGLGTRLMEYLTAELKALDTRRIYLLTARGDISEAFYAKLGFYTSPKMILMARRMEGER